MGERRQEGVPFVARPRRAPQTHPSSQSVVPAPAADEEAYASLLAAHLRRRQRIDALAAEADAITAELGAFEREWQTRLGTLVADHTRIAEAVHAVQQQLIEAIWRLEPEDEEDLQEILEETELDAEFDLPELEKAAKVAWDAGTPPAAEHRGAPIGEAAVDAQAARAVPPSGPERRDQVRRLYRELAKRAHPDLSEDAEDQARREALMQRVNTAYAAHDLESLVNLMQETEVATPGFLERPLADRLRWARAELARLDDEIERLRTQLLHVQRGAMWAHFERYRAGEPVFEQHEDHYERLLREESKRLDRLTHAFDRLDGDVGVQAT